MSLDTPVPPDVPNSLPATSPAPPQPARPSRSLPAVVWGDQLTADDQLQLSWLWHGYLAPGRITLLTSLWKSGKTTLLSILLARLKTGGTLGGLALAPGKAAVVSEESLVDWHLRSRKLDLGGHVCFLCRPFRGKPRLDEWEGLLDHLADLHARHGLNLVVIDPLSTNLPGRNESSAGIMIEALAPLRRLTERGLAVLLLHHPGKEERGPGLAARGSGALPAYVDIILEMDRPRSAALTDRRRCLRAFSRYDETLRHLLLELNAEGTDYLVHAEADAEEFTRSWQRLRMVLEDAHDKVTRQDLLADWPLDFEKPSDTTLYRWLEDAVAKGLLCQEGTGRKNEPFLYWLPAKMEQWQRDPLYQLMHQDDHALKVLPQVWTPDPPVGKEG